MSRSSASQSRGPAVVALLREQLMPYNEMQFASEVLDVLDAPAQVHEYPIYSDPETERVYLRSRVGGTPIGGDRIETMEGYWSRELQADVEIYETPGLYSVRIDGVRLVESKTLQGVEAQLGHYYMVREDNE